MSANPSPSPASFDYQVTTRAERIADHTLTLEGLVDFEATVDAVYRAVDHGASTQWLEDLCPMFGVIWPAARVLATHLARDPGLPGTCVLELGCGLALPSMIAARCGADVWATDQHPDAAAFFQRNLDANRLARLRYERFDWRGEMPPPCVPDRVIASDILYAREQPPFVAAAFRRLLPPGARGIVADPGRSWLQEFVDAAEAEGLRPRIDAQVAEPSGDEAFLIHLHAAD